MQHLQRSLMLQQKLNWCLREQVCDVLCLSNECWKGAV